MIPAFRMRLGPSGGGWIVAGFGLILALAPWWRNREFLREYLDYGIMMAGVGRIAEGQRPYVDFGTPLQSATLWLNWAAERIFGGTFLGMTWGNAVLITMSMMVLTYLLAGKSPRWLALLLPWVVVVSSAGQHTIIWYNSIGVICLAIVTWASANAPLLSRRDAVSHALVCAALVLGGGNKLNFHLVALSMATGWTLRAVLLDPTKWKRGILTLLLWLLSGTFIPWGIELVAAGATPTEWTRNIFGSAAENRGQMLNHIVDPSFYVRTLHDYYGPVFRPAGALIVSLLSIMILLGWRNRAPRDRILLVVVVLMGWLASSALLATNREIVYVALAAGLTIIVSIWMGFGIGVQSRWPWAALWIASGLIGSQAWISSWHGQRMLYGHHSADRFDYREIDQSKGNFNYFKGTLLPREVASGIESLAAIYRDTATKLNRRPRVFMGRGLEALYRAIPTEQPWGLPLWVSDITYEKKDTAILIRRLSSSIDLVIEEPTWNFLPSGVRKTLERRSLTERVGIFRIHHLNTPLPDGIKATYSNLEIRQIFGGNIDYRYITFGHALWGFESAEGIPFLGTSGPRGEFQFELPVNRIENSFVFQKNTRDGAPVSATFSIESDSTVSPYSTEILWSKTVELSTPSEMVSAPITLDVGGRPVRFKVEIAADTIDRATAGWNLPTIKHSYIETPEPPSLRKFELERIELSPAIYGPAFENRPAAGTKIVVAKTFSEDSCLTMAGAGEIWVRASSPWSHLRFQATVAANSAPRSTPVIRLVWYEGGRVQILDQMRLLDRERGQEFHGWPAEDFGWFGVLIDPTPHNIAVNIRIHSLAPE